MSRFARRRLLLLTVAVVTIAQWGCCRRDKGRVLRRQLPARIVLDPGHGGKDAGAWLTGGQPEKELVLDVALRVERLLKEKRPQVLLTRRTDVYLPLGKRAKIANDFDADLLVSIHANSCDRKSASGFEIYYVENAVGSESLKAARFIQQYFKRATGVRDRGIRKHRYFVLAEAKCPSVLVEVGYLSNAREARLLSRHSYRGKVAEGIAKGIIAYIKSRG